MLRPLTPPIRRPIGPAYRHDEPTNLTALSEPGTLEPWNRTDRPDHH